MKKCLSMGLGCDIIPSVKIGGDTVSSTRIRAHLVKGEMEQAAALLGHPHVLSGEIIHGRGLGAKLFCPTANMAVPDELVELPAGGYETVAVLDGVRRAAITNIGRNPTVSRDKKTTAETHIIGFDGDIYGKTLRLEILRFIRPEVKFDSFDALRAQILSDVEDIRLKYQGKEV